MKKLILFTLYGLICLSSGPLFANPEILYEQLPDVSSNGGATSSTLNNFNGSGAITAENFQLTAHAMVTGLNWWGRPFAGGANFQFTFYADDVTTYNPDLTAPGEIIHITGGSFVSSLVNVGSLADPVTFYSAILDTPVFLEQGKVYWVSVYNNAEDAVWHWLNSYDFGDGFSQLVEGNSFGWATIDGTAAVHFQVLGAIDFDGDTISDNNDNCPATYNPDQSDLDDDGTGDVCDIDADGDNYTFNTDCDDFNFGVNPGQCDVKNDGIDQDCDGFDRNTGKPCEVDAGSGPTSEGPGETCSDGLDNDNDGLIDCNDPGCFKKKVCK